MPSCAAGRSASCSRRVPRPTTSSRAFGTPREELLRGSEQQVEAPVRLHARDDPDHLVLRRQAERRAHARVRLRRLEAREVDGAEGAGDRAPAAQRCVAARQSPATRRADRRWRDRRASGSTASARCARRCGSCARSPCRSRRPRAARQARRWSRVCQQWTTSIACARSRSRKRAGVGAIAEQMHAAAAIERRGRSETRRRRFGRQRAVGVRRRARVDHHHAVSARALRLGEAQHRLGRTRPLPVAGELEDPQA